MVTFLLVTLQFLLLASLYSIEAARPGSIIQADGQFQWIYNVYPDGSKCGYDLCPTPKQGMINVHLVAHTHDDVGWVKTVDQYYYENVRSIINSVIEALMKNPSRKFIYVESAFFSKWWNEQNESVRGVVRQLLQEGRLEFVGGGWSMNDEAASHYQSIVDQMTWGLKFLNDTFGECGRPRVGWQIDPFGHSREQASLFAQMGYDGLFFGRLDWNDKEKRLTDKTAEMIWKSNANFGDSDLFTSVLYNHYMSPDGLCFDVQCSDRIIDGPGYNNVMQEVDRFVRFITIMQQRYKTNNLLVTMGGDFTYMNANINFDNMDKLIKYTNARQSEGSNINVFYSTPTCYLKAVHDTGLTWPTKTDDFFPYASDPHAYWTGYFTSRPASKRFERYGNHFLKVCKQLSALSPSSNSEQRLSELRAAMGVMQHHDAITGTEKQYVAEDYHRMLFTAIEDCGVNTNAALSSISKTSQTPVQLKYESCHLLNISQCGITESKSSFVVTLYNPLASTNNHFVRLPVSGNSYVVRDNDGNSIPNQLVSLPQPVENLFYRQASTSRELVFIATNIPSMGYRSYYVTKTNDNSFHENKETPSRKETVNIGNTHLSLSFDGNGFLSSITSNGKTHRLQQQFFYYKAASGNNLVFSARSSGAYIFRPNGAEQLASSSVQLEVIKGDLVQEVHQVFNNWISQVIRVYKDTQHVEFEWMLGPIPVDDGVGKEVITRFFTDIQSGGTFYTDSNGRQTVKRVRNHRDTWNLQLAEPVAGNYYPVTTKIALDDGQNRLAILTDRSQGGTSMRDGVLELMVHRRLLYDDAFGVGEALNEQAFGQGLIVRGKHWLVFETQGSQKAYERILQNHALTPPWQFFSDATSLTFNDWQSKYNTVYSAMPNSLPPNVNLLTFEPWKEPSTYLVRFEHLFEKNEDSTYSAPVTFNLLRVFSKFKISSIRETTLAANQWKEDESRLQFNPSGPKEASNVVNLGNTRVTLNPMQIRTFVIQMSKPEIVD